MQNSLKKSGLLPSKSAILVAVSGGPDSMALLHVLHQLAKKFEWRLAVAHVNYGLRAEESQADAELVKATAKKLAIPFYLLRKKMAPGTSEEALRTLRYAFFEELAEKHQFDLVALAHHQDDQAETVLLRLIRGSGSLGLSAMQPKRGIYVRPFLAFPKQQILDFLKQTKIPYRLDASNAQNVYLRNKVRNILIPLLETYNPNIKKVLAETASTLRQEQRADTSNTTSRFLLITQNGNHFSFSRASWQALTKNQQVASVRQLFGQNNLALPTKKLVETLLHDFASSPKKGLAKDFFREYSRLSLRLNDGMIDIHFKELD